MATITIRETDLTSVGINDVTSNAAYIPGYAIMGPINTPTLCQTLSEFKSIFGDKPYKFTTAQAYPTFTATVGGENVTPSGAMYEAEEYEKSYTYAADLLKQGLPIYYERIFDTETIGNWRASKTISGLPTVTAPNANPTVAFTGAVTDASVNALIFAEKTNGLAGTYVFTYDDTDAVWTLDETGITPLEYGLSIEGTPTDGDTITVTYTTTSLLTVTASDNYIGSIGSSIKIKLESTLGMSGTSSDRYKLTVYRVDENNIKITDSEESKQFVLKQEFPFDNTYVLYTDLAKYFTLINITWLGIPVAIPELSDTALTVIGTGDEFTVAKLYHLLNKDSVDGGYTNPYEKIQNNGDYNIKFITSGAYPLFEAADYSNAVKKQAKAAANRHDSTALIDFANKLTRTLSATSTTSVKNCFKSYVSGDNFSVNDLGEPVESYTAMFIPYGIYTSATLGQDVIMPGSFGYLSALSTAVQTNTNWLAIAGVKRGIIPTLKSLCQNVTNAIANSYQTQNEGDVAINPITNISPYGFVIWGNRTALQTPSQNALKASAFLNVRQLVSDLKKVVYVAATKLTFDPNSDILWINFKSEVEPMLTKMLTSQGITKYKLTKVATTKKATVVAKIRIWPIEAVEDWDITIELADGTTTVSE